MSDGLDALDARAAKATRRTAPPRPRRVMATKHPAPPAGRRSPAETSAVPEVPEGQESFPGLPAAPQGASEDLAEVELRVRALAAPAPAATTAGKLAKIAVYLDEQQDSALEDVCHLGKKQPEKLDVSKSAVVRLALERMLSELTHQQVVDAIAARPVDAQTSGRKRR